MSQLMQPAVVTIYGRDGTKTRKPVGVVGKSCHLATKPYEVREIPGQTTKTPTPEAYQEPAEKVRVDETLKTGG